MPLSDAWTATPVTTGKSGARVERLTHPTAPTRYVKTAPPTWDRGLDAEAARLQWLATTSLAGHVPAVVEASPGRLVTTEVPGVDGATLAEGLEGEQANALARRFGATLRGLHDALDPAECPFDGGIDARLAWAERRIAEAGVDVDDLEEQNQGRAPSDLLRELRETRPGDEDLVVAHGDWCYPNIVFADEGEGWGMVDVGGLGVACRWNDLGIGCRTTVHNLGEAAVPAFLDGYGTEPDDDRIRWYLLLDELQ